MFGSSTKEGVKDCASLSLYPVELRQPSVWLWDASVIVVLHAFKWVHCRYVRRYTYTSVCKLEFVVSEKGEHTFAKNALKSWNKNLRSPVKLQVKRKLVGEAPSRKGEPCLKILYGKSQPRSEMLAFSFDTVSSDLTWVLSALQCDPRAQVQKCPIWGKVLPPVIISLSTAGFAKDFKIRSPLKTKPFHL